MLVHVSGAERFMALLHELDRFSGHWFRLRDQAPELLDALRQVATVESVGASTRIEGAQLSDEEVSAVLQGLSHDSFRARDEQEVRGYRDLSELVFESHADMPISENTVKSMHAVLLRYSDKDQWHKGEYKRSPNHVEMTRPDGSKITVFQTAPPAETRWWMTQLIDEFNAARASADWHPLVLIADFVGWFLAIHPFQDGNGRLSRALTTLLLLQTGYAYVPYASLEAVIEDNKVRYYGALRTTQTAMVRDASQYGDWLGFFLGAMKAQQRRLEVRLQAAVASVGMPETHQRLLEAVRQHGPQTSRHLAHRLDMSERTARYHLSNLVKLGRLQATKRTAGRLYSLPHDEFRPPFNTPPAQQVSGVVAQPTTEVIDSVFEPQLQRYAAALPNGRAYATVVVAAMPGSTAPLGDAALDAFDTFVSEIASSAVAVRATPEVAWWHIEDESHADRVSLWLHPGPVVEVHWGIEPYIPIGTRIPLRFDPTVLVAYWRLVIAGAKQLLAGLGASRCVISLGLQTLPAAGGELADVDTTMLPELRRTGEVQAPSPWRHQIGDVATSANLDERLVAQALDLLLRHYSYRRTESAVEAALRLAPRQWSPTVEGAHLLS